MSAKPKMAPGCGYACPYRDWVSGLCEKHGPTEVDQIVEKAAEGFRRDLARILGRPHP